MTSIQPFSKKKKIKPPYLAMIGIQKLYIFNIYKFDEFVDKYISVQQYNYCYKYIYYL
jgi:hypothetical protein